MLVIDNYFNGSLNMRAFVVLAALGIIATSPLRAEKTETKEFESKSIKSVLIENSSGLVKVVGGSSAKASVTAEKVKFEKMCSLEIKQKGDVLSARVRNAGIVNTGECQVNLTLNVPSLVKLSVKSGSGDLDVSGTKGQVDYKIGSGNVHIDSTVEKLNGKSGSGETDIKGLTGSATIAAGSGSINLTYPIAPATGDLDIKTGSGTATVFLPGDTKVMTSTAVGSGTTHNDLGDTKDAKFKVSFKAGSGDLNIKKL